MSGIAVAEAMAALSVAYDAVADCDVDALTAQELLSALDELQTLACRLPAQSHRMLARLQVETTAHALGAKSWRDALATRWRISTADAGRRLTEAGELGPRYPVTGPPLAPQLPAVAVAQAAGAVTAEHVSVIRRAVKRIPGFADPSTRSQFEVTLVRQSLGAGPDAVIRAAERLLFLMDQDGPVPDDRERTRRRGLSIGKQDRAGMIPVSGWLTPEAAATWEPIFAQFAAPGMCYPRDETPCATGTPSQAQIDADDRSLDQRRHDALLAMGRVALMSDLGSLNGLPVSVIIRTTLQDLESRAGIGTSGAGTTVPIGDVIRMAGHANCHLAVFDGATGAALSLLRARRIASPAQRIMLAARDGGCTKPNCTVGVYGAQAHHAVSDWANGGLTNVDDMALACGVDNRLVDDAGWRTRMNGRSECEWIPPERLDTGQSRVNSHHRPETLLRPPPETLGARPPGSVRSAKHVVDPRDPRPVSAGPRSQRSQRSQRIRAAANPPRRERDRSIDPASQSAAKPRSRDRRRTGMDPSV